MTDFAKAYDRLLRAGLVWRDARRAVFGQLSHYKKMDQYSEACDALEKVMNELAPVGDKTARPTPLVEALEKSVRAADVRQHAEYTDDHCPICSGGVCKAPVYFGVRPKAKRRRHG
jgi:hypothetical protein